MDGEWTRLGGRGMRKRVRRDGGRAERKRGDMKIWSRQMLACEARDSVTLQAMRQGRKEGRTWHCQCAHTVCKCLVFVTKTLSYLRPCLSMFLKFPGGEHTGSASPSLPLQFLRFTLCLSPWRSQREACHSKSPSPQEYTRSKTGCS